MESEPVMPVIGLVAARQRGKYLRQVRHQGTKRDIALGIGSWRGL